MNQDYYISLIIKRISDQLDRDQLTELNQWLAADESNQAINEKLIKSWKNADQYKSAQLIDEKKAWENVSKNLPTARTVIPLWRRPLAVAASVLLVFSCLWLFFPFSQQQEILYSTTKGEILEIELPDGSAVTLNENSQLAYNEFENLRNVDLQGEALFDVTHDSDREFIVKTEHTMTTVLGTTFYVKSGSTKTEVSLFEGSVSFNVQDKESVLLKPGERVSYSILDNNISHETMSNENDIAWKTKRLSFKDDNITQVVKTLEEYFDKNIELKVLSKKPCRFTGSFKDSNYDAILDVMSYTYEMDVESIKNVDKITIRKCQ